MGSIEIVIGDITKRSEQAIVNSANTSLLMGGGLCGAIHLAAGPELERECLTYSGCPVGEARITTGCDLLCEFIIHAVAPRYFDGSQNEEDSLRRCYTSIFSLTEKYKIKSIAIPSIGTGIYGYPLEEATDIAIEETKRALFKQNIEVIFCCFDAKTYGVYSKASFRVK